jgi:hypothetical protein
MSTLMKFEKDANILQFEAGGDYPARRPVELLQVQDRTAAGTLQVETLGITIKRRTIVFNLMTETDYNALLDWFLNIVNGGAEVFDFTDEYGTLFEDVRITDNIIDFPETSYKRYSGELNLEFS